MDINYLVCIIGRSASGKDSLIKELIQLPCSSLNRMKIGTTRPKRSNESEGDEYSFYTEEQFQELNSEGKLLEHRAYDTCYGIWRYFTLKDFPRGIDYITAATVDMVNSYSSQVIKGYKIIPIYLDVDDYELLLRGINREKENHSYKYDELCRRFLSDKQDYSQERLNTIGNLYSIKNKRLDSTVKEIFSIIEIERAKDLFIDNEQ